MRRHLIAATALLACGLVWFAGLIMGYADSAAPAIPRTNVPGGRIDMTGEPYLQSPYVVDSILDSHLEETFYERPEGGLSGTAEQTWRVYAAAESVITMELSVVDDLVGAPRIWLYDERAQVIASGEPTESRNGRRVYRLRLPASGMYKVRMSFAYEDVLSIRIRGDVTSTTGMMNYSDYLKSNEKLIEFRISDSELEKLEALLVEAKRVWEEQPPDDVLWPRYQGVKGRVFGSVWTKHGGEARVAIGIAGRSLVHIPQGASPLPSLEIKVLAGPLPYGLKQFRLYTEAAKYVSELVHTSFLEDFGILSPRQDRVSVRLNGQPAGQMMLLEDLGKHFYEAAQRYEGPVYGFDPDKTSARFYDNTFAVKNFATNSVSLQGMATPNLADPTFTDQIDKLKLLLIQSYGFTFAAYHGLGQGDMRYHWNSQFRFFDPMVKDLDAGIWAPQRGSFHTWWAYLAPIASLWRPEAVTLASYYVEYSDAGRKMHKTADTEFMALWHTPPSTLQIFSVPANLNTFGDLLHMWASPWSRHRINSRLKNISNAVGKPFEYQPLAVTQDLMPPAYWAPLGQPASPEVSRIGSLIAATTDGAVKPTQSMLDVLQWRNSILKMEAPEKHERASDGRVPSKALTFLYRDEEPNHSNLIFIERNPGDQPVNFGLKSLTGISFQPERIRNFPGAQVSASIRMIEINDVRVDEHVRLYWFRIPRALDYLYLQPRIAGSGMALTPRDIAIAPRYPQPAAAPVSPRFAAVEQKDRSLTFTSNRVTIDGELVVPRGQSLVVASDTEVSFTLNSCMIIEGDLHIAENARLTLRPAVSGQGWNGVHFRQGGAKAIRNLHVDGVGHGKYQLKCGGVAYTGGVSLYETTASISNMTIRNSQIEDALHLVRSEVKIDRIEITNSQSDCIDADFSVVTITNSSISKCKGDGLDVSGSLLNANKVRIFENGDKNISVGENSRAYVTDSLLADSAIGIASKDGSRVYVTSTTIRGNREGISMYSKKPFFAASEAHVDSSVRFEENLLQMAQ